MNLQKCLGTQYNIHKKVAFLFFASYIKTFGIFTVRFQLIVQFHPFILVRFLTSNSFYAFEAFTRLTDTLLIPRTRLILQLLTVIFNPFDWLYLLLIAAKTKSSPLLKVISTCVALISMLSYLFPDLFAEVGIWY